MPMKRIAPNMVRKHLVAFADLFNNYRITRPDNTEYIVPVKLATAEKILSMAKEPDEPRGRIKITLPIFGIVMAGMTFDSQRAKHPSHAITSNDKLSRIFQPIPYNISVELGILASKASELFNLLEQVLPFFQNHRMYPMIDFKFIDGSEIQHDVPVILDSASPEIKSDIGQNDENVFMANLSFTMKGWIHHSLYSEGNAKLIEYIDVDFEQYIDKKYEDYLITAETGGGINTVVTGFV